MRADTKLEYRERIGAAIQFVLSRIDNPPSPVEIADYAGFSRFHFGRVFSLATGEPLAEFVRRLRLERAAWELEHTDDLVSDIGIRAGYESLEGFSRAFREWFRITPTDFRQQPYRHEVQCPSEVHWHPSGSRSVPLLVISGECEMEARIEQVDEMNVVALRHSGPYYLIGEKFGRLHQWAVTHQVPFTGALGIWRDNPDVVPQHELRSDACLIVAPDFTLPETDGLDLRLDKVGPGEYGVASHFGPYEGLGDAWARFCGQAIPALGRETAHAPSFEVYVNDCSKVKPEEIQTDLYIMLK